MSEELSHIYVALRRLKCLQTRATGGTNDRVSLDTSLFPKTFLLKQLDERLKEFADMATQICTDLFKQVGGQAKRGGASTRDSQLAVDPQSNAIRYPEFHEYFHSCIHRLYDFTISFCWHEIDIRSISNTDSEYVANHLKFIANLFTFQDTLVELINKDELRMFALARAKKPTDQANSKGSPQKKSNIRDSPGRRDSPKAQRRVRFKDLPPERSYVPADDDRSQMERKDLRDNHSVFALDLLIYGINIYVQRLADALFDWSSGVQTDLDQVIDSISDSKTKIRARQLQVIAKKIKIYNDVHLTVLDHLDEIKRTYLIRNVSGALLALDARKLLKNFKIPRIRVYIQRIGLDVEAKILLRLAKQCLQIFFNLIICEMNTDPTQPPGSKANKSHENVMNFVFNWLKVDQVLFGENKPRGPLNSASKQPTEQAENLSDQFRRPQLVAKTSTLSVNEKYQSSSRILAQADNLGEFMREFVDMIAERLRHEQQLKYFLEVIAIGLTQVFQVVAPQLEQQLLEAKSLDTGAKTTLTGLSLKVDATRFQRDGNKELATLTNTNLSVHLLVVKLRCLKFVHVISLADKIVANKAASRKIDLDCDLDSKLAKLTQDCMETK